MCVSVCICVFVLLGANEVFSKGGLLQSGEGGPAVLSCFLITSVGRCEEQGNEEKKSGDAQR